MQQCHSTHTAKSLSSSWEKKEINFFPISYHWPWEKAPPFCPHSRRGWVAHTQEGSGRARVPPLQGRASLSAQPPAALSLPLASIPPSSLFPPISSPPWWSSALPPQHSLLLAGSPQPPPMFSSSSHSHLKLLRQVLTAISESCREKKQVGETNKIKQDGGKRLGRRARERKQFIRPSRTTQLPTTARDAPERRDEK